MLFYEGFETSSSLARWAPGFKNETRSIVAGGAAGSVSFLNIVGSDSYYGGLNYAFPVALRPGRVSWWTRVPSIVAAGDNGGTLALSSSADVGVHIASINLDYNMYATSQPLVLTSVSATGGWDTTFGPSITVDTWHQIELDFDWSAQSYVVKLDGATIGETVTFTPTAIARIDIWGMSAGNVDFDEIVMTP